VENAAFYEVYRRVSADDAYVQIGSSPSTSYLDDTPTPGISYYYKVAPCNDCGCGDLFGGVNQRADGPLDPPVTVTASENLCDGIRVTWDAVIAATVYEVYRSVSPDGPYSRVYAGSNREYFDYVGEGPGVPSPATTYYYKVSAGSGRCGNGPLSEVAAGYSGFTPGVPQNVSATDGELVNEIRVTWDPVDGARVYEIWRHWAGYDYRKVGESNDTYWFDHDVLNSTYYYRVKACAGWGENICCSDLSEEDSGTCTYEP
jgi:fibronectin type 3 domain-containing protein